MLYTHTYTNTTVRGGPVFSVMAAGWICEKSGGIGKVDCEIGGFHPL